MCRFATTDPVLQAAETTHPVQGFTYVARWVRTTRGLAVGLLVQSSGEEHVLSLQRLEQASARGDVLADRILDAVTGR